LNGGCHDFGELRHVVVAIDRHGTGLVLSGLLQELDEKRAAARDEEVVLFLVHGHVGAGEGIVPPVLIGVLESFYGRGHFIYLRYVLRRPFPCIYSKIWR